MNFKKGQTATEYLIILAVVIVIALIVVGVLGGIPSIGGGAQQSTIASYWRTSEIGVVSMSVGNGSTSGAGGGSGTITLRNNRAGTITIQNVTLTDVSTDNLDPTNTSSRVLSAGQTGIFEFINLSNSGVSGESYSYLIEVSYTDASTGASYTFKGDGNNLVGTIADTLAAD